MNWWFSATWLPTNSIKLNAAPKDQRGRWTHVESNRTHWSNERSKIRMIPPSEDRCSRVCLPCPTRDSADAPWSLVLTQRCGAPILQKQAQCPQMQKGRSQEGIAKQNESTLWENPAPCYTCPEF